MNIIKTLKNSKEHMPDLQIKEVSFGLNKLYIINLQSVSSSILTNEYIMEYLSEKSILNKLFFSKQDINNYIPSISFISIDEKDVFYYLFNGFSIIIYKDKIHALETRATLDRGVNEPTSEPTIKGPKDSFNENYNTNIGLIRKRIKTPLLHLKEFNLGKITNTKTCIFYIDNLVDKQLLNKIIDKINNLNVDKILDSYDIKTLISKDKTSLFPTIKSTEKPDTIAKSLTEGKICIMCENSNNILIIPTFFIDFFHNDEDNFHNKIYAKFIKTIRFIALFITIFAPSIYLALITYDEQMLPMSLLINFSIQRFSVPFPAIIESFILIITFELLNESDGLTPSTRGTSLSILGALVLGDAAVQAGIVSPITVIIIAITAISSLFFTYLDFQSFIRLYRYTLMIISSIFGFAGIILGFLFILTDLCNIKAFGKPFMIPFSPKLNIKNNIQKIKNGLMPQNTNKGEL